MQLWSWEGTQRQVGYLHCAQTYASKSQISFTIFIFTQILYLDLQSQIPIRENFKCLPWFVFKLLHSLRYNHGRVYFFNKVYCKNQKCNLSFKSQRQLWAGLCTNSQTHWDEQECEEPPAGISFPRWYQRHPQDLMKFPRPCNITRVWHAKHYE